ncbi:MAG: hypothetical protein ACRDK4_11525 [Solirubrobacteraceae bacterium]
MNRHIPTRRLWTIAGLLALAASCALASTASATLVYVRGGFPTSPPKLPAPEWVWSAHNDGSAHLRLARGSSPHLSPDGKLVAYDSFAGGKTRLAVIPTSGGTPRVLIGSGWQDQPTLAWSPDSKTLIAVVGTELGTKRLVRIDVQSGRTLATLASAYDFFSASFSPDSSRVVYTRAPSVKLNTDLFVVTLATGHIRALTSGGRSSGAVWGKVWIVFSRSRKPARANDAPKQDLYLVRPAGTDLRRLTVTHPGFLLAGLFPVAWSSSANRLLAEFGGQDTSYAETVNPQTGRVRRVGTESQGFVGWALSRDGRQILATTGGPEPNESSNVVTVPYGGNKPRVLARHAHNPDWNA